MNRNSKKIRYRVVRKRDLVKNVIECRRADMQKKLAELIASGYTIFDMASAASGFATLGAQTAGNYVVVWKGDANTSYDVALANITVHTKVVVVLARVNSANQVIGQISTSLSFASGSYTSKLLVYGGVLNTPAMATPTNFSLENTLWKINGTTTISNVTKTDVHIVLNADLTETDTALVVDTNCHYSGAYVLSRYINFDTTSDWLSGVLFDTLARLLISGVTSARTFNFTSVKITGFSDVRLSLLKTTDASTFFYDTDIDVGLASTTKLWNQVGSAGLSSGAVADLDVCKGLDGYMYAAYSDGGNSSKLSVAKCVGGTWTVIGTGLSTGAATYIRIKPVGGVVSVVYADAGNSGYVRWKAFDGSTWSMLLEPSFVLSAKPDFVGYAYWTSGYAYGVLVLIFQSSAGIFYVYEITTKVVTQEQTINSHVGSGYLRDAKLFTFNVGGVTAYYALAVEWHSLALVSISAMGGTASVTTIGTGFHSASICNGFVVGYYNGVLTLYSWSNKGGTLTTIGAVASGLTWGSTVFTDMGVYFSAVLLNGSLYVVYFTSSNLTAYVYNSGSLSPAGSASFTAGTSGPMALSGADDTPYVAYNDSGHSNKLSVMKYDDLSSLVGINHLFSYSESNVFASKQVLATDLIADTDSYDDLETIVAPRNTFVSGTVARTMKNSYQLTFDKNRICSDGIKQTGPEDFVLRDYEYYESELVGKVLKNLKLYSADMAVYDYNNNDNVLVRAVDASGNEVIMVWYSKQWWRCYYSDWYPNVTYTIQQVFQMLEITSNDDFVNAFSTIDDSPLESGTLVLNNYDNEVIAS